MRRALPFALALVAGCQAPPPATPTTPTGASPATVAPTKPNLVEYPGAPWTLDPAPVATSGPGEKRATLNAESGDPPAKVAEFFKKELKLDATTEGQKTQLIGRTPDGGFAILVVEPNGTGSRVQAKVIVYEKEPGKPGG